MEIKVGEQPGDITLGPVLFNWKPESWRDFYFRIADEAPVTAVYLGETVCSKRAVLFEPYYETVAERLSAGGKTVVFSTLSEVVLKLDRKQVESTCAATDYLVEANDGSALLALQGRPHHIGPFVNVYNERTLSFLAGKGARNFCLPPEMPATAIRPLCAAAKSLDVSVEVQVFGRIPLALSARCYHARAHGRIKDSCQFVCENDPDGLATADARRPAIPCRQRHPDDVARLPQSGGRARGAARHGRVAFSPVAAQLRHDRGRRNLSRRARRTHVPVRGDGTASGATARRAVLQRLLLRQAWIQLDRSRRTLVPDRSDRARPACRSPASIPSR